MKNERTERFEVRLTPEERENLELLARRRGISSSDYIRFLISEQSLYEPATGTMRALPSSSLRGEDVVLSDVPVVLSADGLLPGWNKAVVAVRARAEFLLRAGYTEATVAQVRNVAYWLNADTTRNDFGIL